MAAAAATTTTAAAGDAGDDFSRVYDAVATGASEHELRRVIEECAQGDDRRRVQAVNQPGQSDETPLHAAHGLKRGDLVGALVEAGADVGGIHFGDSGFRNYRRRKLTPLALCIAYGQVESVRALLRAGHDPNAKVEWHPLSVDPWDYASCTPAHVCLAPPPLGLPSDRVAHGATIGALQIGCLEVLLREGGAEVDSRDSRGQTPTIWLARFGSTFDDTEEKAARYLLASSARLGRL